MFILLWIIIGGIIYLCVGEFFGALFDLDGLDFIFFWPVGVFLILIFSMFDGAIKLGKWLRTRLKKGVLNGDKS